MKKIIYIIIIILISDVAWAQEPLSAGKVYPQLPGMHKFLKSTNEVTDSSLSDYFPLQKGNIWQYGYRDNPGQKGWIENMISLGDTLMPDGFSYTRLLGSPYRGTGYVRIDSHYNVREYFDSSCNLINISEGDLFDPPEIQHCISDTSVSLFKLGVPDSSYWFTYRDIGQNIFWPSLRYMGEYEAQIFGLETKAKIFIQYFRQYSRRDSSWTEYYGWEYIFIKGIGIYHTGYGESTTATLQGAIINGVQYGTVVGVDEQGKYSPAGFTLYQNYPNPFNPITNFEFHLPAEALAQAGISSSAHVEIKVYDIIGREVAVLVNEEKPAGGYTVRFDANGLASGVYYYQLRVNRYVFTRKMLLLK